MSRAYNARRKARKQAQVSGVRPRPEKPSPLWRLPVALVPIVFIAAVFAAAAVLGFGSGNGTNRMQVDREVSALLAGIPQDGTALGSSGAPITVEVYADLECPTVKIFVEKYLPSLVDEWVRPGTVKLEYHSLKTDTASEQNFFRQEIAAQAAGRQDKMWDFLLTFVHEQGDHLTGYATDQFVAGIAARVPGLERVRWREDREDPLLARRVSLDVYGAHQDNLRFTPSFALRYAGVSRADPSVQAEFKALLLRDVEALREEAASEDVPGLRVP